MGQGLRYTMNNLGDLFVDKVGKFWCSVKRSTKGIKLTHNIHELSTKKIKIQKKIGKRLSKIQKESPELAVFKDKELSELFTVLEGIDSEIAASTLEREERLYPKKPMDEQYT